MSPFQLPALKRKVVNHPNTVLLGLGVLPGQLSQR